VEIEPVADESLPKMGISKVFSEDFREFAGIEANYTAKRRFRTARKPANSGFSEKGAAYRSAALPGWGGSVVRACLRANSLQTGNFTGNLQFSTPVHVFDPSHSAD
jgi:hypothetical protein